MEPPRQNYIKHIPFYTVLEQGYFPVSKDTDKKQQKSDF
jgi:hypothetical protein